MRIRIILTTNNRIVTRYVEVDNLEQAKELIPQIMEEEGLGNLKHTRVVEVDKNNKVILPSRIPPEKIRGRRV